jgi:hypothetical protein
MNKIVKVEELEQYQNNENNENNYGCSISWVYGLNTQGESKPFIPIKLLGEAILYRVSSIAIIYDIDIN